MVDSEPMLARRTRLLAAFCLSSALLAGPPREAHAQAIVGDEARVSEAKVLFTRGSDLYLARKYQEAIDALQASYTLLPSPNSGLLVARCFRALNKPVEAVEMYLTVEADARRRVADGETKYGKTAAAATVEGAEVRAGLGSIKVRIDSKTSGATLLVDGSPWAVDSDGIANVWHLPGEARVTFQKPGAADQIQVVTVPAGGEVHMEFGGPTEPALPPPSTSPLATNPVAVVVTPPPQTTAGSSWAKPAAWVAGVTTLAGFGVFAGFGIASKLEYNDLQGQCPCLHPTTSQTDEANTGKRNQLIANIGVIAGSAAAAATLTFVIIAASSSSSSGAPAQNGAKVTLGLGSAGLDVPF
jgi:hypothetical protein